MPTPKHTTTKERKAPRKLFHESSADSLHRTPPTKTKLTDPSPASEMTAKGGETWSTLFLTDDAKSPFRTPPRPILHHQAKRRHPTSPPVIRRPPGAKKDAEPAGRRPNLHCRTENIRSPTHPRPGRPPEAEWIDVLAGGSTPIWSRPLFAVPVAVPRPCCGKEDTRGGDGERRLISGKLRKFQKWLFVI
jgi:hypothetical protein